MSLKKINIQALVLFISCSEIAFAEKAATSDASSAVVLRIDRMMCGGCTSRVRKLIETGPGTSNVSVRLEDHTATFTCDKSSKPSCDLDKIIKDLRKIGYPPKVVSR